MRQFATKETSITYKGIWRNNAVKIEAFETFIGHKLFSDSFTNSVIRDYVAFLRSLPVGYKTSTVATFLYRLKRSLSMAADNGFAVASGSCKVSIKVEDSCAVYFNEAELLKIFEYRKLSKQAHAVREWFLISCCVGFRWQNMVELNEEDLKKQFIRIVTNKSIKEVLLPVHWMVRAILERNNGKLPKLPTQQAFGQTIKRVCKKIIESKILYARYHGLKLVKKWVPKYSVVSPHTGRRTLATNMYLAGIPTKRIMLITGHKTEEAFFRYIRIDIEENAEMLYDHPFFTGQSAGIISICPKCYGKLTA